MNNKKTFKQLRFVLVSFCATLALGLGIITGFAIGAEEYDLPNPHLSAMIDNHVDARPASGVNEADAVYEFPVEGEITRMMVVYKNENNLSSDTIIGPIRSARPFFARVASAHKSIFAHAGGNSLSLSRIDKGEYNLVNMDALNSAESYFYRNNNLSAPHNLFTTIGDLENYRDQYTYSGGDNNWPWNFVADPNLFQMYPKTEIEVDYQSDIYDVKWVYDSSSNKYKRYIKTNGNYELSYDANSLAITSENIVIQYTKSDSFQEIVDNEGRAMVCRGGYCLNGKWKRDDIDSPVKFYYFDGKEVDFINGKLWINITQNTYFHDITLKPGWSVISTPRVVESHQFTADETLENFGIFVLDPDNPADWSTMAELGQTEFTPLYGYFVYNRTNQEHILTLNYNKELSPNNSLFNRELSVGWNILGVASPDLDLEQNIINGTDTNNVQSILSSLNGKIQTIVDFTNNEDDRSTVALSDEWKTSTFDNANSLDDFRTTKAYGVFLSEAGVYQGTQNTNPIHHHKQLAVNFTGSGQRTATQGESRVALADIYVKTQDYNIRFDKLPIAIELDGASGYLADSEYISNLYLIDKDRNYIYWPSCYNTDGAKICSFNNIYQTANKERHFELRGDIPSGFYDDRSYIVRFSENNGLSASYTNNWTKVELKDISFNKLLHETISVEGEDIPTGTYEMDFDLGTRDLAIERNLLAGSLTKIGRIKINVEEENAILNDLNIEVTGTATNLDIAKIYLFWDENLTDPIANDYVQDGTNIVSFENIGVTIPKDQVKYIYVGGLIPAIDYSNEPSSFATASAGKTIALHIIEDNTYKTELIGEISSAVLTDIYPENDTYTSTMTVMGSIISSVDVSDLSDTLLKNGWSTVFKFKVTAPDSVNKSYLGTDLWLELASTTFTITKSSGISVDGFSIEKVGSDNGAIPAVYDYDEANGKVEIGFHNTFALENDDRKVNPGETVEYQVNFNISGVEANKALQAYIINSNSDMRFYHTTYSASERSLEVSPGLTTTDYLSEALTN